MATNRIDNLSITGDLSVQGTFTGPTGYVTNSSVNANADIARTKLLTYSLEKHVVPLTDLRVWDAFQTVLPGTAASDDLALIGGTFGSATPLIQTSDAKNTTVTQYARFMVALPPNYPASGLVYIRLRAGMITTVANGTATVDVQAYESDKGGGLGSDLVTTPATTINSLTEADKDFVLTDAGLAPGDWLDVRITIAITDSATGTAVIGSIGSIELLCDTQG
jgi:hypothetical protein